MKKGVKKDYIKFALIEALYFGIFSFTTYQTVFLKDLGITSSQIGMIVSAASLAGMLASPVWGMVSDLLHSARITFWLSAAGTTILFAGLPLISSLFRENISILYIYIPAIFIFKQASNSLLDSWCIGTLSPQGIQYGSVRMWGSAGYSLVSVILGILIGTYCDTETAFYFMLPLLFVLSCFCLNKKKEKNTEKQESDNTRGLPFLELFANRQFIFYLLYAFGLNIYLSVTLIFMPYVLEAAGCQPEHVGTVTGFRALLEIASMFLGAKLSKKIPIRYIMIMPGLLFGIEHICYQFAENLPGVLGIMVFSGLAGGFFYSLGPSYIFEIVPKEVITTAQTINAMNLTFVSIIGSVAGGFVIRRWGIHTLTTGSGVFILILTAIFIVSIRVFHNNKREKMEC
ncbi:MFS transporter [Mediterraneibacter sp. NSJ-55]|uniref:MFS transporter n=1 Tax=Mediterraneibacter hominis TaxID=2763054 RepID=A0A923RSP2_9FIRM|nr:MFS transporter [Mediterraneibacter hominis]MBC5689522.1 MFS transporter [Mediterraneibacter hominis]